MSRRLRPRRCSARRTPCWPRPWAHIGHRSRGCGPSWQDHYSFSSWSSWKGSGERAKWLISVTVTVSFLMMFCSFRAIFTRPARYLEPLWWQALFSLYKVRTQSFYFREWIFRKGSVAGWGPEGLAGEKSQFPQLDQTLQESILSGRFSLSPVIHQGIREIKLILQVTSPRGGVRTWSQN